ncbi:MAG TPA: Bax inhibitor-1/YccA family protein [Arenimonas sp.]|nr:Bax inhibitor-1/YccA family protein [Arenimonas sp.]HOZ04423.1 Bax inhibitor-1/YccA family protein [Arenimonas sp.]HPO23862.1 Bax inhibitor-1/YccA family protein [Arenimonas sp.]HPW33949.1 Bax inhibitor-1/YccA family protein [Arenimonas sp.]
MRSGNPALNQKTFEGLENHSSEVMTINGTVNKTSMLLAIVVITSLYTWSKAQSLDGPGAAIPLVLGGAIGALIVAFITIFKKTWSPVTAPLYAGLEGLALGGISAFYEAQYPGIVLQAVTLTFGTLAALLMAYRSGLIKVTENFKLGVVAATGGIAILYLINIVMGFFGHSMGFIHNSGWIGIGFSAVVVVVASLNLVLDFDFIESGAEQGAPKYMEWYASFGLILTLVWLYLELLRLLSKLRD